MLGDERGVGRSNGNSDNELNFELAWSGGVRNGSTEDEEAERECGMVEVRLLVGWVS